MVCEVLIGRFGDPLAFFVGKFSCVAAVAFRFDLDSSSMSAAGGNNFATALADITQIRILHNPNAGDYKGAIVSGSFTVDPICRVTRWGRHSQGNEIESMFMSIVSMSNQDQDGRRFRLNIAP